MMRRPEQRRADLRAQLAAGRIGALRTVELHDRVGRPSSGEAFAATLDYAERRTRACLAALATAIHAPRTCSRLARATCRSSLQRHRARRQRWRSTSPAAPSQHEGNLNCPLAVTRSACYFAVRVLTDPDIPATAGAYRPVEVIAPEGSLLNARPPAAVVGATSRPRRGSPTSCCAPSGAPSDRAR